MNNRLFEVRGWHKDKKVMVNFDDLLTLNNDGKIDLINELIGRYPTDYRFMQYTNIKDRKGKYIYEGDIAIIHDSYSKNKSAGVVDFENGSFIIRNDSITHYRWNDYEVEVIGNIFENKELLVGGVILWRKVLS